MRAAQGVAALLAIGALLAAAPAPAGSGAYPGDAGLLAFGALTEDGIDLFTLPPDGGFPTQITDVAAGDLYPAWSPDGRRIAFTSQRDGDAEIYVAMPDGSGATNVTGDPTTNDAFPTWSPDGTRLAFVAAATDGSSLGELVVLDLATRERTVLAAHPAADRSPTWSPDGSRIAFTSERDGGDDDIYTVAPDGTGLRRLTSDPRTDFSPSWSPDGTQLAFVRERSLWRMDADGGNPEVLIDDQPIGEAAWSPAGDELACLVYSTGGFETDLKVLDLASRQVRTVAPRVARALGLDWQPLTAQPLPTTTTSTSTTSTPTTAVPSIPTTTARPPTPLAASPTFTG